MEYKEFIGIDVSKEKLDVLVRSNHVHLVVCNTEVGMAKMLKRLESLKVPWQQSLFCFEHTGIYSLPLRLFLADKKAPHVQVSGLAVKRSMGIRRGKNDKVDAAMLSIYAHRLRDELVPAPAPNRTLLKVKRLFSLRERLVRDEQGLKSRLGAERFMLKLNRTDLGVRIEEKVIKDLELQIKRLNKEIKRLITLEPELKRNLDLATSVKGIGQQIATYLLVTTENFTLFANWRKYACYAGIAPFENRSGSSLKGRTKTSQLANKRIKALLGNGAASVIQCKGEIASYYKHRLAQGKQKMSTLNIVRNKLLSRVFAAVQRGTPYVDLQKFAA